MKVWQFLKWVKAEAIITIEPESRKGYYKRKMRKGDFASSYAAMPIEQFEIIKIEFNDTDDYGIIITVKEEERYNYALNNK